MACVDAFSIYGGDIFMERATALWEALSKQQAIGGAEACGCESLLMARTIHSDVNTASQTMKRAM
jgi:hypothetical protein